MLRYVLLPLLALVFVFSHPTETLARKASAQKTQAPTKPTASVPEKPVTKHSGRIIATGPVTGIYFPAGGAIQRIALNGKAKPNFDIWPASTDGSLDNLQGLRTSKYDYAIVQSDWQYYAFKGEGVFKTDKPFEDLRAIASLYVEPLTVLARSGSEIYNFGDLKGKDVSFGAPGTSTRMLMEEVSAAFGLDTSKDLDIKNIPITEVSEALCSGQVDAIAFASVHPNGLIQEAANKCQIIAIPIAGSPAKSLLEEQPFLTNTTIPGGIYPGIDSETETIGFTALLVALKSEPEDEVYQLTKSLFSNVRLFASQHPAFSLTTAKSMHHDGISIPFHSGAERYFKEAKLD